MPLDSIGEKRNKEREIRIYVCEYGDIRIETKHSRYEIPPEKFAHLIGGIVLRRKLNNEGDTLRKYG